IGKLPISVPAGVAISVDKDNAVTVKGPKGSLTTQVDRDIAVAIEDGTLTVTRPTEQKRHKAMHGLYRSLINNMVTGVSTGFTKQLELVGVGYKASLVGSTLELALADMRRIAVQWMADDRFALNAFEGGADYGQPGHITAGAGPLHVALGDPSVDLPMMAEVYTLPAKANPRLTIEAAVTATTCGRELIGETLFSEGGKVTVAELTMALPDCDDLGGFVVLNNPLSDMKLALAE
ncbi:MAG: hypothetical protein RLZZ563_1917, partial [Pseudomonadota bacterium]